MAETFAAGCGRCRYFRPTDALNGSCRRFPPVYAGNSSPREPHHWRFPAVNVHGWCGEFQPGQMSSSGVSS